MKIGVATIYYKSLPLTHSVKMLARMTDYIMISPIYEEVTNNEIEELKDLKESLDLEYYVHGLFPNRGEPLINGYKSEFLKETLETSYKLESPIIIIHPSKRDCYEKDIAILREICKFANDLGIELAIENKPEDYSFLKDEEDFDKLISDVPEIKFCIDTSHFFLWSGNSKRLAKLIETYKEYIAIFHIADARVNDDLQMVPGYGEINWYTVGKSLAKLDLRRVPLILESIYPTDIMQGIKNLRHVIVENL